MNHRSFRQKLFWERVPAKYDMIKPKLNLEKNILEAFKQTRESFIPSPNHNFADVSILTFNPV
jgi:hypothetical protein